MIFQYPAVSLAPADGIGTGLYQAPAFLLRRHHVTVEISLEGNISSAQESCPLYDDAWRRQVERNISAAHGHYALCSLQQVQELGVDYLDIYGHLDRAQPCKMHRITMDDFVSLLPGLDMQVRVETVLQRTFDLESPLPVDGSFRQVIGGGH